MTSSPSPAPNPLSQTLTLLDLARSGITETALNDIDPTLIPFGLQEGLIRILPASAGHEPMVHLTGTALERSLALRDEGNPILGVDIQPHGLNIVRDLSQEQWFDTLRRLRLLKSCYHIALSDLIAYGRSRFGDTLVDQTVEQLEFSFDDITHATTIAHVPRQLRQTFALTSEHYYVLGLKFPTDPTSQEIWAQRTQEHRLSPHNLRRSIEHGQILTDAQLHQLSGHGSGIPVLQGLSLPFSRWSQTVGGIQKVKTWDPDRKAQVLRELSPLVEFALELRESLEPQEA